jgi:hypothetical protein
MVHLLRLLACLALVASAQAQEQETPFVQFAAWAERALTQNPIQKSEKDEDYVTFSGKAPRGRSCQVALTRKQADLYYVALGQAEGEGPIESWIGVSIGGPTRFSLSGGRLQIRQASVKPGINPGELERTGVIEMSLTLAPQGPAKASVQWQRPGQDTIRFACTFPQ